MKIHQLNDWQFWYDTSYKTWYAAQFDKEGNQTGDTVFAHTKEQIKTYCV